MSSKRPTGPIIIKKYANRRLYDTGCSSYVTLEDLCEMVKRDQDFVVVDAKTNEDITRSILTQIIADQETTRDDGLLPLNVLKQLIGFYDGKMHDVVPHYLEQAFAVLTKQQEQWGKSMGGMFPGMQAIETIGKQNMALFENAMRAMTPFAPRRDAKAARADELRRTIAQLQKELAGL